MLNAAENLDLGSSQNSGVRHSHAPGVETSALARAFSFIRYVFLGLLFLNGASVYAVDTLIEGKGAYFYPADSTFRKIYSPGAMWGVEASFCAWRDLYAWGSGSVFIKKGHSIGLGDSTRVEFYPIAFGLKYLFPVKPVDFYLGAGPLAAYMHIHDHSEGIPQKTCRWGGGGILKGGAIFNFMRHFFLDLFTDYSFIYVPVSHRTDLITRNANLSGWSIGLGLGCRFGKEVKEKSSWPTRGSP